MLDTLPEAVTADDTMARKRPKPDAGKAPQARTGLPLHVYLEPALRQALDQLAARSRRSVTAEVSIALENHLKEAGLWPPAAKGGEA
jgi:hypothetical protein